MKEKKYKGITETIISFFIYVAIAGWIADWDFSSGITRFGTAAMGIICVGSTYLFSSGKINNI